VILLGAVVLLWGALVLGFAPMLHTRWKGMLTQMRRAGVRNDLPGIAFFASAEGLRKMRIAGVVALAVGAAMVVAGLLSGRGLAG
jgi:hypothetical protein